MQYSDTMTEKWGTITEYDTSMAAQCAHMFNAFNEIWPGGFRGGIPFDEKRVKDWLDNTPAIVDLIACDAEENPVGYCGLYPNPRDTEAAYVSILGVHPKVLGKKYGKRLLLKAVEIASEKHINRVDLNTWSGNLKAVPLYKKVGFCWVPDTQGYMQNYIPGLFQNPLVKEWMNAHPDWYNLFQRDVTQAPDQYTIHGMEVYPYTFEADTDCLTVFIDRYGWQISGIERVLHTEKIVITTALVSHTIFIGIENAVILSVTNETGKPLDITVQMNSFPGLTWREPAINSLTVKNGETITVKRAFVVDNTVNIFEPGKASEAIQSLITINGQSLQLHTGGKILPAVSLRTHEMYTLVAPEEEHVVYMDVINNTQKECSADIHLFLEGIKNSYTTQRIDLAPREVSGIEVPVKVLNTHVTVVAVPTITVDNSSCNMPKFYHTVVQDIKDLCVAVEHPDAEELVILTDCIKIQGEKQRGLLRVGPRFQEGRGERINFEVGPPFGLSLDRTLKYDYTILKEGVYTTVVLTGDSVHLPGIHIKKYIRVAPGTTEIEFWASLINMSNESIYAAGKTELGTGEGISIDLFDEKKRIFTPVNGAIIESDPSTNFVSENMIPEDPQYWEESWTAAQSLNTSDFSGWIWDSTHTEKITVHAGSVHTLESKTVVLHPGETYEPAHVWHTFSHGSLRHVRNRWNQLVGHKNTGYTEKYLKLETIPPVYVTCSHHVLTKGKNSIDVTVHRATSYPLPGKMRLQLPSQWKGHFVTNEGTKKTVTIPEDTQEYTLPVEIDIPCVTAAEKMTLHFSGEFEIDFVIPVIIMDETKVVLQKEDIDNHAVTTVDNGVLQFMVVSDTGGNLIRLQDTEGHTYFADNFPDIKPKGILQYNIGGIHPFVSEFYTENPFSKPEKVQTAIIEEGPWKGVKAWWKVQNQDELRGQKFSVSYLVLPGSPVVRIQVEHENTSPRLIKWNSLLLSDIELQGSIKGTVITAPGGCQTWVRNQVPHLFKSLANLDTSWVTASKKGKSVTFFVPEGVTGTVIIVDLVEMIHGVLVGLTETEPHKKTILEFALVINQPQKNVDILRQALGKIVKYNKN
ncbi:MAG: GNAT family N-acetyltransferase [Candidatus Methanofastidiosia archaeon]|jgi:ribosomal protein S18 acetylase RimI-like enzyme